jgi:hypothetical protein
MAYTPDIQHVIDSIRTASQIQALTSQVNHLQYANHDFIENIKWFVTTFATLSAVLFGIKWFADNRDEDRRIKNMEDSLKNTVQLEVTNREEQFNKKLSDLIIEHKKHIDELIPASTIERITTIEKEIKDIGKEVLKEKIVNHTNEIKLLTDDVPFDERINDYYLLLVRINKYFVKYLSPSVDVARRNRTSLLLTPIRLLHETILKKKESLFNKNDLNSLIDILELIKGFEMLPYYRTLRAIVSEIEGLKMQHKDLFDSNNSQN